jgi:hypothetical protein
MILTASSYFSDEANKEYMSVSQYKDFKQCSAAALAKLQGQWQPPENEAFTIGSYFHSYFDGTIEQFKAENPQILCTTGKNKGQLKSEYQQADLMIQTIARDDFAMYVLQGEKEVIMTGEICGVPIKIKVDTINHDKHRFVDLKTVKDFNRIWNPELERKVTFVEQYGYLTQLAVYREIIKQNTGMDYDPYIVAVTKESIPDKVVLSFNQEDLTRAAIEFETEINDINDIKHGRLDAVRCGKCAYCKSTKQLSGAIHYSMLGE